MIIDVTGRYSLHKTPQQSMDDMLRYDDGELLDLEFRPDSEVDDLFGLFSAKGRVQKYTPERWKSFGMNTKRRLEE